MEKELKKQPQEAGLKDRRCYHNLMHDENGCPFGCHVPPLEELIDMCGTRVKLDWFPETKKAFANCCDRKHHEQTGATPTEAIVKLWLAINKPPLG